MNCIFSLRSHLFVLLTCRTVQQSRTDAYGLLALLVPATFNLFIQFLFSSTLFLSNATPPTHTCCDLSYYASASVSLRAKSFKHEYELRSLITTARRVFRPRSSGAAFAVLRPPPPRGGTPKIIFHFPRNS